MIESHNLFTDDQMKQFITNGYVTLKPDLPQSLHDRIYEKLEQVNQKEGNPGNNVLPRIPEIQEVFDHPNVRGAFTSVLGPNFIMHPHRHPHLGGVGRQVQGWHKDSYWGYGKVRNHHSWWAMGLYYPQDTPIELGPTGVIPGSQYHNRRKSHFGADYDALPLEGEAGTITIIHYDLWHRGNKNVSEKNRYMLKFQFVRMDRPSEPTWNNQDRNFDQIENSGVDYEHQTIWRNMWRWASNSDDRSSDENTNGDLAKLIDQLKNDDEQVRLAAADQIGQIGPDAKDAIPNLIETLEDPSEPIGLNAAYALAEMGDDAIEPLISALENENGHARLNAGYALTSVGSSAVPKLIDALKHDSDSVRELSVYALGEIGESAIEAVPKIAEVVKDDSVVARRNAVESLGLIQSESDLSVSALISALNDDDGQVRFTSVLSLARLGERSESAIPALKNALKDENRYVRAYSTNALRRIDTAESKEILIDYLTTSRWCPSTTKESTF